MENSITTRKIHMDCPLCGMAHEVEERRRMTFIYIKDEMIEYEEVYYYCSNSKEDENEFETGKMTNVNLLNARNAFRRKHQLLTSEEIVAIREKYGLSQVELAKLLGWGEATISRYESKSIQDESYDNMLRIINDNPMKTLELLEKNKKKFPVEKLQLINQRIIDILESQGKEYLSRQALKSEYVLYKDASDYNGNTTLNIDKLESVVSYFAERIPNLYKVKLMKLLWYADTLSFNTRGMSMTGLVYRHEKMGALPIGHNRLLTLENIHVQEEEGYDGTMYHFYKNDKVQASCLSTDEIHILDTLIRKFKDYSTQQIVDYMHREKAYIETKPGEIIPFTLAKTIRTIKI